MSSARPSSHRFTKLQLASLKRTFERNPNPTPLLLKQLAREFRVRLEFIEVKSQHHQPHSASKFANLNLPFLQIWFGCQHLDVKLPDPCPTGETSARKPLKRMRSKLTCHTQGNHLNDGIAIEHILLLYFTFSQW